MLGERQWCCGERSALPVYIKLVSFYLFRLRRGWLCSGLGKILREESWCCWVHMLDSHFIMVDGGGFGDLPVMWAATGQPLSLQCVSSELHSKDLVTISRKLFGLWLLYVLNSYFFLPKMVISWNCWIQFNRDFRSTHFIFHSVKKRLDYETNTDR